MVYFEKMNLILAGWPTRNLQKWNHHEIGSPRQKIYFESIFQFLTFINNPNTY